MATQFAWNQENGVAVVTSSFQPPFDLDEEKTRCSSLLKFFDPSTSPKKIQNLPGQYPLVNYHNYIKSQFFMGKSSISMAIFKFANCKRLPEGSQVNRSDPESEEIFLEI